MMLLKCHTKLFCGLLLMALLLTACAPHGVSNTTAPNSPEISAPAGEVIGNPLPLENRQGRSDVCPSSAADGYYRVSTRISFYDASVGTTVVLCAQPGCSHMNEACQAWIGEVKSYTEYHGLIYAIRGNESVQFIRKNLSNGNISVLAEWRATDTVSYDASLGVIADGMAVIYLNSRISRDEGEDFSIDTVSSTWLFDLETGEKRELFSEERGLSVLALSAEHAVVQYTGDLLSPEEYAAEHGDLTNYGNYAFWDLERELRLYDSNFNNYTALTSTEQGFVPYSENNMTYGKELVYAEGNGVFLVNVDTGESRQLLTLEGIINYWLMDQKVFLISREGNVLDADSPMSLWYADITDGELVRMENGGRTDIMAFSIGYEGQGFFLSTTQNYISKADFYAEDYENIK